MRYMGVEWELRRERNLKVRKSIHWKGNDLSLVSRASLKRNPVFISKEWSSTNIFRLLYNSNNSNKGLQVVNQTILQAKQHK